MIASVQGMVAAVQLDSVVIEVGGVGLLAQATPNTLAQLRVGEPAQLATSLVVREDSLTLFGFATSDERDVFETVQTVSGVGPRLALAMLAVHTPDGLRQAVANQDLNELTKVPGIGRKGAQRIVLELSDRLGAPTAVDVTDAAAGQHQAAPAWHDQVVSALVGLGWQQKIAAQAVDAVTAPTGTDEAAAGTGGAIDVSQAQSHDVAGVLRAALQHLGRAT